MSSARDRRFLALVALAAAAALAALLLIPTGAFADAFTPESGGSKNADEIDSLYKIILVVAIIVFVGVEGALFYSLFKFRARKGAVASQIHGNTRLEIGWTVGAAAILVVLTVITFAKLGSIKNPQETGADGLPFAGTGAQVASTTFPKVPGGKRLLIAVDGQQYIWRYTYSVDGKDPGYGSPFTYEEMTVPVNTTVVLRIRASDVAHSWWIPKLGGKFDAIPGYTNYTWFKATKTGTYTGQCAELCGRNHANMTARVKVVPVADYQQFIDDKKQQITDANKAAQAGPPNAN